MTSVFNFKDEWNSRLRKQITFNHYDIKLDRIFSFALDTRKLTLITPKELEYIHINYKRSRLIVILE